MSAKIVRYIDPIFPAVARKFYRYEFEYFTSARSEEEETLFFCSIKNAWLLLAFFKAYGW